MGQARRRGTLIERKERAQAIRLSEICRDQLQRHYYPHDYYVDGKLMSFIATAAVLGAGI